MNKADHNVENSQLLGIRHQTRVAQQLDVPISEQFSRKYFRIKSVHLSDEFCSIPPEAARNGPKSATDDVYALAKLYELERQKTQKNSRLLRAAAVVVANRQFRKFSTVIAGKQLTGCDANH